MKHAFITGMGRSGTKFLSNFLSLDKNIHSSHEHFGNREFWLLSWYLGEEYSRAILCQQKDDTLNDYDKGLFVDVNSYLSNSIDSLNKVFENPHIFHLVRNPKRVVPSIMTRRNDDRTHKLPKTLPQINNWIKMSKLEQVCTNWVQTTENLLNSKVTTIKFEDLIEDYHYINKILLNPLEIKVSQRMFEQFKTKKINKTRSRLYRYMYSKYKGKKFIKHHYTFDGFTNQEVKLFYDICGETMLKLDYK